MLNIVHSKILRNYAATFYTVENMLLGSNYLQVARRAGADPGGGGERGGSSPPRPPPECMHTRLPLLVLKLICTLTFDL